VVKAEKKHLTKKMKPPRKKGEPPWDKVVFPLKSQKINLTPRKTGLGKKTQRSGGYGLRKSLE